MFHTGKEYYDILLNLKTAVAHASLKKNPPLLIASFDQEKAFDRVNHDFMLRTLRKIGMGSRSVALIKDMYNGMLSKIEVNGRLSRAINIQRGIRQGCPLSMLLYVIQAEPLARHIQRNTRIPGFRIGPLEEKLQQFADDNTLLSSTPDALDAVTEEFHLLQTITGQKVNPSKTEILCVGKEIQQRLLSSKYAPHVKSTVKILGVYYGKNSANMTWDERLSKVQAVTNACKARRLTWFGRINILNSLAMSQLLYHARVINIRKDVA